MKSTLFYNNQLVSSKELATRVGYTNDYISRLCRFGKVDGKKVGNAWYVDESSLRKFIAEQERLGRARNSSLSVERSSDYRDEDVPEKSVAFYRPRMIFPALLFTALVIVVGLATVAPRGAATGSFSVSLLQSIHGSLQNATPAALLSSGRSTDSVVAARSQSAAGFLSGAAELVGATFSNVKRGATLALTAFGNMFSRKVVVKTPSPAPVQLAVRTSSSTAIASLLKTTASASRLTLANPVFGINARLVVRDNVDIGGSATLGGALRVSGASTLSGSLRVAGGSSFAGLLQALGGIDTGNADINVGTGRVFASNLVNGITAGDNITITGTPQNPIISAKRSSGGGGGSSGLTSVGISVPDFLSVSGSPLTSNGSLSITYAGTALPVANGGTGSTTLTGILVGSTTDMVQTLRIGTGLSFDGTTLTNTGTGGGVGTVTSINASGGTTGLDFTGGAVTTSGTLTLTGTLGVANGGTGWTSIQSGALLYGNGAGALATTTEGAPGQVLAYLNGVPTWAATTTAGSGLAYTSGAFNLDMGSANVWTGLQTFQNGFLSSASSTIGNGTQTGGLTISGGATTTGAAYFGGTARVSSTLSLGTVASCAGSSALQTDGSGNVSCGSIASLGISTAGGWSTDSLGNVTLATTSDRVGIGATTTPYAKLAIKSGAAATTTLALVPFTGQTANVIDIYDTNGALASVFTAEGRLGLGTTTPGTLLSLGNTGNDTINLSATATSTFGSGLNLRTGCYAVNGECLSVAGLGGLSVVIADYPLLGSGTSGSHLTLAFGTSTSNTWDGTQTFLNAPTLSTLTGLVASNNGTLYQTASSTLFGTGVGGYVLAWNNGTPTWVATSTLATITGTLSVSKGGTGSTTPLGGILLGNGSSAISSLAIGSGLTFDGTTLAASGSGLTALGSGYATTTGGTITFATSTASFNGLTFGQTIVPAAGSLTFTPTISGTLSIGGGGTGLTNISANRMLYTNAAGALIEVATSSSSFSIGGNAATATTLLTGNTINGINFTGASPITITAASSTLLADSSTFSGTNTFTTLPILGTLTGLVAGNNGTLYQVASSSLFGYTPQTNLLAKGNFLVGDDSGFAQATSSIFISSTGLVGIGKLVPTSALHTYVAGDYQLRLSAGASAYDENTGINTVSSMLMSRHYDTKGAVELRAYRQPFANYNYFGNDFGIFVANSSDVLTEMMTFKRSGNIGIATTTPTYALTSFSSTTSQLALSAGPGIGQWAFRNAGGNLYFATTTVAGTATSTLSALTITGSNGYLGIGTSTPGSILSINGVANFTTATSTFYGNGLNIANGCYALGGSCITAASLGATNYWTSAGGNIYNNTGTNVGVGSSTPWGTLSVSGVSQAANVPSFVVGSSTKTDFIVMQSGYVGVGAVSPTTNFLVSGLGEARQGTFRSQAEIYDTTAFAAGVGGRMVFSGNTSGSPTPVSFGAIAGIKENGTDSDTAGALAFYTRPSTVSFAEKVRISSTGNLGIGSSTPWGLLSVNPNALAAGVPAFVVGSSTRTHLIVSQSGNVGIGTTTPTWLLNPTSATAPQLALSAGAGVGQWAFRNARGNLYFATTTVAGNATSTLAALTITGSNGYLGIATSTPGSLLSIGGVANFTTATSTFYGDGLNLSNGCYAVNGVCLTSGGTNYWTSAGGNIYNNTGTNVGVGSSTPWGTLSVNGENQAAGVPSFVVGSSTKTDFVVTQSGNVGIGTTTPWAQLSINPTAFNAGAPSFVIGSSTMTSFLVDAAGRIGIGTTSTSFDFGVQGQNTTGVSSNGIYLKTGSASGGVSSGNITLETGTAGGVTGSINLKTNINGTDAGAINLESGGDVNITTGAISGSLSGSINLTAVSFSSAIQPAGGINLTAGTNTLAGGTGNVTINSGLNGKILLGTSGNGLVGVGTTTPQWLLTVASSTAPQLALSAGAGVGQWAFRNAGGDLYFATTTVAGTATSTLSALSIIGSNGYVGIASTSPTEQLSVAGRMYIGGTGTSTIENNLWVQGTLRTGTGTMYLHDTGLQSSDGNLVLSRNGISYLNGGNVGIGTTTPASKFSIQGNQYTSGTAFFGGAVTATSTLTLTALAAPAGTILAVNATGQVIATSSIGLANVPLPKGNFLVGNDAGVAQATSSIYISSTGLVGIGTTTPWGKFSVNTGSLASGVPSFVVGSSTRTDLVVKQSGNVGIGTTNAETLINSSYSNPSIPSNMLRIAAPAGSYGNVTISANDIVGGGGGISFGGNNTAATGNQILFAGISSGKDGTIGDGTTAGYLAFSTNSSGQANQLVEKMRITAGGGLGIGTTTTDYRLTSFSSDAPQLTLSAGAGVGQWAFRNAGGNLFFATTTVAGTATSSASALTISGTNGNVGIGLVASQAKLEVLGDIISKGIVWTARTAQNNVAYQAVAYGNGLFAAVANGELGTDFTYSVDGVKWNNDDTEPTPHVWTDMIYGDGMFVAASGDANQGDMMASSPDGRNWTSRGSPTGGVRDWQGLAYGNKLFIVVASDGTTGNNVGHSRDGITWANSATTPASYSWKAVAFGNGTFVAVACGTSGSVCDSVNAGVRVMYSSDPTTTWSSPGTATAANTSQWQDITFANGIFVAVANAGTNAVMTSADGGSTWTARTAPSGTWKSVTYGDGLFVAVAEDGSIMTSPDGTTWALRQPLAGTNSWNSVTYGNGMFVAVGDGTTNYIMSSGKYDNAPAPRENAYQGGMTIRGTEDAISGKFSLCIEETAGSTQGLLYLGASATSCTPSSLRYKNTVLTSDVGLEELRQLRPVTFYFNDLGDPAQQLGFIAEEAYAIDPRLVQLDRHGLPGALKLDNFMSLVANAVIQLDARSLAFASSTTIRIDSLEERLAQLESGAVTSSPGTASAFSTSSLVAALGELGISVQEGLAQFGTLVSRSFVASTDSDGTSSAASVTILAGNTVAQINNVLVTPSTKIFVTFNSQVTGSWWVSEKSAGSFRLTLSEVQASDVTFDYFLVQTEGQISTPQSATSTPAYSVTQEAGSTTTAPITITTLALPEDTAPVTGSEPATSTPAAPSTEVTPAPESVSSTDTPPEVAPTPEPAPEKAAPEPAPEPTPAPEPAPEPTSTPEPAPAQ